MIHDSSDILSLLRADHEALRALSGAIQRSGSIMEKKAVFNDFLPLLECHMFAQEETLMARTLSEPSLKSYAMACIEEHDVIEFLSTKMKRAASEDQWLARIGVLCSFLESQLDKEEQEFFPAVEEHLGAQERIELGDRYSESREKLKLAPIIELPLRSSSLQSQSGKLGFTLAWLLGVPGWILLMVFLVGGA